MSEKLNIVVISNNPEYSDAKLFIEAIEKNGHNPVKMDLHYTYLLVSESVNGYDRIYLGDTDEPRRLLAKEMDATITRIGGLVDYGVAVVRHMNENLGIYSLQTGAGIRACANKWETTQTLSRHGIKQPVSMFAYKPKHVNFLINKVGGLPAIAKTLYGSQGKGVMLLETPLAANSALGSMYHNDMQILLQSYINANATGYRAIVLGDEVIASMKKVGDKKEFRDNLAKGAKGEKVTLSEADQKLAVNAAKALGLEFAGVDLIKDPNNPDKTYVIEVNSNPGMKICKVCDVDIPDLVVKYVINKVKKRKEEEKKENGKDEKNGSKSENGVYIQNGIPVIKYSHYDKLTFREQLDWSTKSHKGLAIIDYNS